VQLSEIWLGIGGCISHNISLKFHYTSFLSHSKTGNRCRSLQVALWNLKFVLIRTDVSMAVKHTKLCKFISQNLFVDISKFPSVCENAKQNFKDKFSTTRFTQLCAVHSVQITFANSNCRAFVICSCSPVSFSDINNGSGKNQTGNVQPHGCRMAVQCWNIGRFHLR